MNNIAGHI